MKMNNGEKGTYSAFLLVSYYCLDSGHSGESFFPSLSVVLCSLQKKKKCEGYIHVTVYMDGPGDNCLW